jgi:hypothetical protein
MEGIDLLQNLKNEHERLCKECKRQEDELSEKFGNLFATIYDYKGLKLKKVYPSVRNYSLYRNDDYTWEVNFSINFLTEDEERIKKGFDYEFGANIDVVINEGGLELNYGTCGHYNKNDKGQMSRAMFIPKLWENEDAMVAICKATLNMNDYEERNKVWRKIQDINLDIELAEEARKKNAILAQLRKAKYICNRRIDDVIKKDENGNYVEDEHYNYVVEKQVYKYYNHEEIKKITDSNVLTVDTCYKDNHRRNIDEVISKIQRGNLFLQNELTYQEDIPAK